MRNVSRSLLALASNSRFNRNLNKSVGMTTPTSSVFKETEITDNHADETFQAPEKEVGKKRGSDYLIEHSVCRPKKTNYKSIMIDTKLEPLPTSVSNNQTMKQKESSFLSTSPSNAEEAQTRTTPDFGKYLLYFARNDLSGMGFDEVKSLAKLFSSTLKSESISEPTHDRPKPLELHLRRIPDDDESPFAIVENSQDVSLPLMRKIVNRSVLVKSVFSLWAACDHVDASSSLSPTSSSSPPSSSSLLEKLVSLPDDLVGQFKAENIKFRLTVETVGKNLSMEEKIEKIKEFESMKFRGKVNLRAPEEDFHVMDYYHRDKSGHPLKSPAAQFFGRWLLDGDRKTIEQLSLKKRKYIGNTSMDPEISLIMSNFGLVSSPSFVFDPFVGTGSLLLAAAHHGAFVAGNDIDYNCVHGVGKSSRHNQKYRQKDENIRANFTQYGLGHRFLDVLVADSSRSCFRPLPLFDAIITDPPYGIREACVKVGTNKVDYIVPAEYNEPGKHFPESVQYDLNDSYCDLLDFAARYVTMNGRLVCWFPVYREHYIPENIPQHPCFQLIGNYEQVLSSVFSRRMLVMEKITEFQEGMKTTIPKSHFDSSLRDRYFRKDPNGSSDGVKDD